jgi:Iap family predicted aminopeptidase
MRIRAPKGSKGLLVGDSLKSLLHYLCCADPRLRRRRLVSTLAGLFPDRHRIETQAWGVDADAPETVNHLVTFGREGGHLVIGAHYDSVPDSPGANDNGAGVVQLLSAAKRLQDQVAAGAQEPDVTFCFWDHEELFGSPCMGSRVFLDARRGALPQKAVVFDVSGRGELFVSDGDPADLAPGLPVRATPPSDNLILLRQGIPATLVCALPTEEWTMTAPATWRTLHTPFDTPDRVDERTLELGSKLIADMVNRFTAA